MSLFNWLFGSTPTAEQKRDQYALDNVSARQHASPIDANHATNALEQIQARIKAEETKQKQLDHRITKLTKAAKEAHNNKDMTKAKSLLKQVAMVRKQREQKDGLIQNLYQQSFAMDSAAGNVETAKAMKRGAESIHVLVHQADEELDVHEIADSMQEAMGKANDIANALSTPFDLDMQMQGEDDIEAQLAEWDDENVVLQKMENLSVPSTVVGVEKKQQQQNTQTEADKQTQDILY